MRISNIFELETPMSNESMLMEAARFGRREAGVVMKNSEKFKIGIEYEFDVDEGESAIEDMFDEIIGTKEEADLNKFVLSAVENIEPLVNDYDINEYVDELRSAVDGDQEDIDSFFQFYYGDLKERIQDYRQIQMKAKPIANSVARIKREVWYKYGFPTQTYKENFINLPPLEDADYDIVISQFGDEQTTKMFLRSLLRESESMLDYVSVDGDKIYGFTVSEIINTVSERINKERERAKSNQNENKITKVDVVKESLPINMSFVAGVVPDPTVPNGVEVVTKPISLRDTFQVMNTMFKYIDRVGGTSNSTGLHVNISLNEFDRGNFNAVKAVTLLDPDAYQTGRKYPMRDKQFVDSIFKSLVRDDVLSKLVRTYVDGGDRALIKTFERLMELTADKFYSVNLAHFFDEETNVKDRRIEFRFVGGKNYHTRFDEIVNDIGHMCYVMLAGSSDDFLKKEYYRAVIRLLDRAVKKNTKGQIDTFSQAVDFARKSAKSQ